MLGEFDPPGMNPYSNISLDVVQSPAHRALALKAASMSLVLLKNDKNLLPLKNKLKTVTVSISQEFCILKKIVNDNQHDQ